MTGTGSGRLAGARRTVLAMATPPADLLLSRDLAIPLRDGTVLRGDLYLPAAPGPWPCLLQRTPYIKDFNPGIWVVLDPLKAVAAGFAVLIQDVRGRGRSEGDFTPFANEADDGAETIDWVASQPWCDGRVAMYGSSYMAASQWQAAVAAPAALRAIAPFQASCDYHEGRSYRGGAFEVGALLGVALNALGGGIAHRMIAEGRLRKSGAREARQAMDDIPELARTPIEELRQTVLGEIAPFFFDWAAWTDREHPYWRHLDLHGRHADVDLPVFHLSSWFDQAHVGTLTNFEAMRRPGHPARDAQYLLMGPWSHRVPRGTTLGQLRVGDQYYGTAAMFDLDSLQLRWLRGVLDGDPTPWPFDGRVRYFTTGINRWRTADDWPIPGTTTRDLHLTGEELSWSPPADRDEQRFAHDPADPAPTRGGAHMTPEAVCPAGPVDQRSLQERDDVLVWTSAPLADPVEATGWVEAVLTVAHDAPRADYSVVLSDVEPDGRCTNVCDGYLRVDRPADEPTEIRVALGATSHVFGAGHSIRVHVAGASSPRHDVVGAPGRPQVQRILQGPGRASRVLLPTPPSSSS